MPRPPETTILEEVNSGRSDLAISSLTKEEILNYAADHLGEGNVNKLPKEARDVQPAKAHFSWRWIEAWTQS